MLDFGYKKLEKRMTYKEVMEFLKEHPKYRLLTFDELSTFNPVLSYIDSTIPVTLEDGAERVRVYTDGTANNLVDFNTNIKSSVYVTYSEPYLDALAAILNELDKDTLDNFRTFLPKPLKDKPIYFVEGGSYSFIDKSNNGSAMVYDPIKRWYF